MTDNDVKTNGQAVQESDVNIVFFSAGVDRWDLTINKRIASEPRTFPPPHTSAINTLIDTAKKNDLGRHNSKNEYYNWCGAPPAYDTVIHEYLKDSFKEFDTACHNFIICAVELCANVQDHFINHRVRFNQPYQNLGVHLAKNYPKIKSIMSNNNLYFDSDVYKLLVQIMNPRRIRNNSHHVLFKNTLSQDLNIDVPYSLPTELCAILWDSGKRHADAFQFCTYGIGDAKILICNVHFRFSGNNQYDHINLCNILYAIKKNIFAKYSNVVIGGDFNFGIHNENGMLSKKIAFILADFWTMDFLFIGSRRSMQVLFKLHDWRIDDQMDRDPQDTCKRWNEDHISGGRDSVKKFNVNNHPAMRIVLKRINPWTYMQNPPPTQPRWVRCGDLLNSYIKATYGSLSTYDSKRFTKFINDIYQITGYRLDNNDRLDIDFAEFPEILSLYRAYISLDIAALRRADPADPADPADRSSKIEPTSNPSLIGGYLYNKTKYMDLIGRVL